MQLAVWRTRGDAKCEELLNEHSVRTPRHRTLRISDRVQAYRTIGFLYCDSHRKRSLGNAVNCSTWRCRIAMSLCNNWEVEGAGLQGVPVGMWLGGGGIADLL